MPKRKRRIKHDEIVNHFAARLRELRSTRGMTQAEVARQAHVTVSYIWRLESGGAAPGIDLVARLARALGASVAELLPAEPETETAVVLRVQAKRLFDGLLQAADRETLLMLNPLLARLGDSLGRSR